MWWFICRRCFWLITWTISKPLESDSLVTCMFMTLYLSIFTVWCTNKLLRARKVLQFQRHIIYMSCLAVENQPIESRPARCKIAGVVKVSKWLTYSNDQAVNDLMLKRANTHMIYISSIKSPIKLRIPNSRHTSRLWLCCMVCFSKFTSM